MLWQNVVDQSNDSYTMLSKQIYRLWTLARFTSRLFTQTSLLRQGTEQIHTTPVVGSGQSIMTYNLARVSCGPFLINPEVAAIISSASASILAASSLQVGMS